MQYLAIPSGDGFTFLNGKDSVDDELLDPLFMIEGSKLVERGKFDEADIRKLVDECGGYILSLTQSLNSDGSVPEEMQTKPGVFDVEKYTKQYSVKAARQGHDFYFARDFSAVVLRDNKFSHVYVDNDVSATFFEKSPLCSVAMLLENCWMSTPFNEAIGQPATRFAYLAKGLLQKVVLDNLSGISADFYAFDQGSLLAAWGLHDASIPWLPFPRTEPGAKACNAVLRGRVMVNEADGSAILPMEFPFKAESDYGVYFDELIKQKSAAFVKNMRNGFCDANGQLDLDSMDLSWCRKVAKPGADRGHGEHINALPLFLFANRDQVRAAYRDSQFPEGAVAAYLYRCRNCNTANLDIDIASCLNGGEPGKYCDGLLGDSIVNQILSEAIDIYKEALRKSFMFMGNCLEINHALMTEQAPALCEEIIDEYFQSKLLQHKNLFDKIGGQVDRRTNLGFSLDDIETNFGVNFGLKNLPVTDYSNAESASSSVEAIITSFGAGGYLHTLTAEERKAYDIPESAGEVKFPVISLRKEDDSDWTDAAKDAAKKAIDVAVGPSISALGEDAANLLRIIDETPLNIENNSDTIQKKNWLKDNRFTYNIVDGNGSPLGLQRFAIESWSVEGNDSEWVQTITAIVHPADSEPFEGGISSAQFAKTLTDEVARLITAETSASCTSEYLADIGCDDDTDMWGMVWTDIPANPLFDKVRTGRMNSKRNKNNMRGHEHRVRFTITRPRVRSDKNVYFAPGANKTLWDSAKNTATSLAVIPMLEFLLNHVEELKAAQDMNPICLAENTYILPPLAAALYNMDFLKMSIIDSAIGTLREQCVNDPDGSLDRIEEMYSVLKELSSKLGDPGSVSPVYWLTRDDLVSLEKVEDSNYAPIYMAYGV